MKPFVAAAAVVVTLLGLAHTAAAGSFLLADACPGNLLVNGDFELPDTTKTPSEVQNPTSNPKWGWYAKIPGWYTTRPDGGPCARVDWQKGYIEVAHGALATPIEGNQYGELLPNGTGNYCQDVKLQKGATYKLSYWYGRLMTYAKGTNRFVNYDTAVDVAVRPSSMTTAMTGNVWPADTQGFTRISSADTATQYAQTGKQWVKHEATFVAPADGVTLAFINAKRPKECGSCGSLLDAVCLQKV